MHIDIAPNDARRLKCHKEADGWEEERKRGGPEVGAKDGRAHGATRGALRASHHRPGARPQCSGGGSAPTAGRPERAQAAEADAAIRQVATQHVSGLRPPHVHRRHPLSDLVHRQSCRVPVQL